MSKAEYEIDIASPGAIRVWPELKATRTACRLASERHAQFSIDAHRLGFVRQMKT